MIRTKLFLIVWLILIYSFIPPQEDELFVKVWLNRTRKLSHACGFGNGLCCNTGISTCYVMTVCCLPGHPLQTWGDGTCSPNAACPKGNGGAALNCNIGNA